MNLRELAWQLDDQPTEEDFEKHYERLMEAIEESQDGEALVELIKDDLGNFELPADAARLAIEQLLQLGFRTVDVLEVYIVYLRLYFDDNPADEVLADE